jgi:hypothetical protein
LLLIQLLLCGVPLWAQPPTENKASPIDLVEWLFQRPLTCVEIQILCEQKGWESWAELSQSLDQPSESERATLLTKFKMDRQPFASLACKMDRMARREVSPGLQFQSTEAFAEWLLFGMAVLDGEDGTQVLPGPNFRSAVQATLSGLWPTLSDHYREVVTGFPVYWANLRKDWPGMTHAAKNAAVIGWQNNLANALHREDRIRLASACLMDLQETMRNKPTPQALEIACERLDFAARRLRRPDMQASDLADQLSAFAAQARRQEARELESAALLQKMDIPKVWYSPIWTDSLTFPGYWGGPSGWAWGGGYPYRW